MDDRDEKIRQAIQVRGVRSGPVRRVVQAAILTTVITALVSVFSTRGEGGWARGAEPGAEPRGAPGDPRVKVPHAQRTIARRMPQFRRCFEQENASGKLYLVLTIDGSGDVAAATASGEVPKGVRECVESRALSTHFSSPEGGRRARLDVPMAIPKQ